MYVFISLLPPIALLGWINYLDNVWLDENLEIYQFYARYVFVSLRGKIGPEILLPQGKQVGIR